jgi:XrtJ-associated TM-motif-TM protein
MLTHTRGLYIHFVPVFFVHNWVARLPKLCLRYFYFGFFLLAALPMHAQGGCVDSPENSTAVLGLIGAAGVLYAPVKNKLASLWRHWRDA